MDLNWTDEELAELRAALKSGVRVVEFDGGPGMPKRRIEFQSLQHLREVLGEAEKEASDAPRYRRVKTRRGFRDG